MGCDVLCDVLCTAAARNKIPTHVSFEALRELCCASTMPMISHTYNIQVNCLTEIVLPSNSVWFQSLMALSMASAVANSTLPHPRDLPVSLSVMTPAYMISPASEKQFLKPSFVVAKLSPPT